MDYEKKYKDAVSAIKFLLYKSDRGNLTADKYREELESIIPELKESEDERIRKWLIRTLKSLNSFPVQIDGAYEMMLPAIAWLEKQTKQKPADKVEPKFKIKEGKWYVCTQTFTLRGKIVVIKGQTYKSSQDGAIEGEDECLFIDGHDGKVLNYFKPWTIQDAKAGDVLCTYECEEPKIVFILKGTPKKHYALSYYCYYNIMYPHFDNGNKPGCLAPEDSDVKPATKEQREQLEKAMADAGYTFDFDKKELRKIEQKPAEWTAEDEEELKIALNTLEEAGQYSSAKWLKNVCLVPQTMQKPWSEEDEKILNSLISSLARIGASTRTDSTSINYAFSKEINWLKSLKDRVQPQPMQQWSNEDMNTLESVIDYLLGVCRNASPYEDVRGLGRAIGLLESVRYRVAPQPQQELIEEDVAAFENIKMAICSYFDRGSSGKIVSWLHRIFAKSLRNPSEDNTMKILPKWKAGVPPQKGWWLTRKEWPDGHCTISCESFQNDKWPHEGEENVLYMDMNDLEFFPKED